MEIGDSIALSVPVGRIKPALMERLFSDLGVIARPSDVLGRALGPRGGSPDF